MIANIISILRPTCVFATIAVAAMLIACFWGWKWVSWNVAWNVFLSYLVLMAAGTAICAIDKSSRSDKH
ncbi:hypothetical protein [Methylobacterium oryzae]|uniref:hypothetical protein n=1 Tax=Methylobacterium oryzae TaxID=334852 RepID=UPI002F35EC1C